MRPDTTVWWHVHPLSFVGAESRSSGHEQPQPRLRRLESWLDYMLRLGCNGLMLGPVFASRSHGYDTLDHFRVDPRLGDERMLVDLIEECRKRGICVLLDGVFNHLAREHEIVQAALAGGRNSNAGRWIRWDGEIPATFEGHEPLVELNFSHPPVQEYIASVMVYWLNRGVAGWRLDAAYRVGGAAWEPIVASVRSHFPQAWLTGEVIHGDYGAFVEKSGCSSVTQYELWKAIWSSLNDRNLHELVWSLKRHMHWLGKFLPTTFIGNHDVTRIASRLKDYRHLSHAVALLALLPGVPCIYAGDEQGFLGVKEHRADGDDAIRPVFPANPNELPAGGSHIFELHQRLFGIRRRNPWLATAQATMKMVKDKQAEVHFKGANGEQLALGLNVGDESMARPSGKWLAASQRDIDGVEPHGWIVTT